MVVGYRNFLRERDDERRANVAVMKWKCDEGEKYSEETCRAYERAAKHVENLRARKRRVVRLVERCEGMTEGEEGFEEVGSSGSGSA